MSDEPAQNQPAPPGPSDPWRSFRGVMAACLILEAIVVLLALPVVAVGGLSATAGGYLIGLAVVLILMCGVQGRPWALWANLGLQIPVIAGAMFHAAIGFIGVVFLVVWLLVVYLRHEVKRRQERGLLPGQQRPTE
ncbi:DUF4233 domain-containing protein [Mycolicibacterium goodii]|uniref:DUF4233 domain-containing protein n=1 Tax=Mycolicibacterium goodii TaxID=134601 RepID=UPI001BDC6C31|nr:DUF4233 domain-containing protein [Mycolicibacterium goodii]MBU8830019.1 DUF4233 domain-containing protein [Mycolicibacterium goodii]ULN45855.1 DUF4233 domain-containing protein [Mycolicibacterium goodii]